MELNEIKDNKGAHKRRMRVGRGIGSGKGKTSGRGGKGQTARTGVRIKGFEGGQMPIHRRLPKRGFKHGRRIELEVVNLSDIEKAIAGGTLDAGKPITLDTLKAARLVRGNKDGVKLLAKGAIKSKLTLSVTAASAAALEAVKKSGGTVELPAAKPAKADTK
jgi:large subunit ribosomal protein L15